MNCQKCGTHINQGEHFCSGCGAKPNDIKRNSTSKSLILIIIFLLLFVSGIGLYYFYPQIDLSINADKYFEMLKEAEFRNKQFDNYKYINQISISFTADGAQKEGLILTDGKRANNISNSVMKAYLNDKLTNTIETYSSISDKLVVSYTKENNQWKKNEYEKKLNDEDSKIDILKKHGKIIKKENETFNNEKIIVFEIIVPFKYGEVVASSTGLDDGLYTFNKDNNMKITYFYNVDKKEIHKEIHDFSETVVTYMENPCHKLVVNEEVLEFNSVKPFDIPNSIIESTTVIPDANDGLNANQILNKMIMPTNYKQKYSGSINVTVDNRSAIITTQIEIQKNELNQMYMTNDALINYNYILRSRSYAFVQNNQITVYTKIDNENKWYRAIEKYQDNNTDFIKTFINNGKNVRLENIRVNGALMNVVKVTIPFKYFKSFMIQDVLNNNTIKFNNDKNVIAIFHIDSSTNMINKLEVNYNECALSYENYKINSYEETIQLSDIGKIKEIKLPQEVLNNLAN